MSLSAAPPVFTMGGIVGGHGKLSMFLIKLFSNYLHVRDRPDGKRPACRRMEIYGRSS
jgi:hypothetical protein